jgi:nicotinate-nucleotide pyrophosphorylase (carboxylating)
MPKRNAIEDYSASWPLPPLRERIRDALREDWGRAGDVTSRALVPVGRKAEAALQAKARGVFCGAELFALVFAIADEMLAPTLRRPRKAALRTRATLQKQDGAPVVRGDIAAVVTGDARVLLAAERLALNLVCRLSGIASETARYVARVAPTHARIVDTRKTTPLWRDLEKYAVRCGGGANHRAGLHDMILIKDNHLALWGERDPAGAVRAARARFPRTPIEVEVTSVDGLAHVCEHSEPEYILLDNFPIAALRDAVRWHAEFLARNKKKSRALLEASGGVSLQSVQAIAQTGVDRISVGALTHSVRALDFSLEMKT